MTDTPGALAAALAELQTKLPEIKKSERADVVTQKGSYSYSYANLAGISAQIMPLLGGLGLSFIAKPTFHGDRFVLAYSLLHVSGEREDGEYPLPTSGTPQAIGSAITYGRRYCLCAVTGIAPEEDDDDATAAAQEGTRRGTAQRTARPRQQARPAEQGRQAQRAQKPAPAPPLPGDEPEKGSREGKAASSEDGNDPEERSQNGDFTSALPAQMKKMHATFNDLGITDRDKRLAITSTAIARRVESANDLTKDEATTLINRLIDVQNLDPEDRPIVIAEMAAGPQQ